MFFRAVRIVVANRMANFLSSVISSSVFLQVAVSKARKHATLVHSLCLFALPIQH
jgi:hypothetical protein